MKRVLVTGGSGFVGHWLKQSEPEGFDVTYINRQGYNLWYWWTMDWDYIIHAAPVSPGRVLSCINRCGARVLYVSSGIVYYPENNTEYRRNKLNWEKYCLDSVMDVVIARLFTFYGDKLTDDHAIVAWQKAAEAGEPLTIWGDGKAVRSYMHGAEMARWIWAILLHGQHGEAYDVGSDTPITLLDLANGFAEAKPGLEVIIENSRPDPMPVYLPKDTAKTKALLGVTEDGRK